MALIKHGSKGQALIIVLVVIAALLAAGAIFLKTVFSEKSMVNLYVEKEKAFYLAEAGLENGRSIIAANPNWFTENPHLPADDPDWLMNKAAGSVKQFGGGSYKIVRESGDNVIYSVGYFRGGRSAVRIKFNQYPFKAFEFKII
jgi:Tfp pilus assembly protein PilX